MAVAAVGVVAVGKRFGRAGVGNSRLVHMRVMADVAHAVAFFVRAVTRRRTPSELERQSKNEQDEQ